MESEFKGVKLRKTSDELIKQISERRDIPENKTREMMLHEVWTVGQFADLTGKDESTINNLIVKGKQKNLQKVTALNICFPFPRKNSHGPKHIIRDELSLEILRKSLE